jgi:hypothetical protein
VAEAISKLKKGHRVSGEPGCAFVEDGLTIAGLPVVVSDQVDAATTFWGISKAHTVLLIRSGTEVLRSTDSAFQADGVDIKAVFRYGLGFLHQGSNVRGYDVP